MVVFEKKSQCSTTPSMILNMKNITRCDKFIPKLVTYYLVYRTYLCKQTGAASCAGSSWTENSKLREKRN